jgi:ubiquinone/menaquinone biosynthesis C-methylase UbiE
MIQQDAPESMFWDRKALTTSFNTPLPEAWFESCGLNKETARILDAGCGQGRALDSLASSGWARLWGVDYSPEMVKCASDRLGSKAHVHCTQLSSLPFDKASFDLILCFGVINTIANDCDLRHVFEELARVSTDNADLLVNDYGLGTTEYDRTRYLDALPTTGVYGRFISAGYVFQHRPVGSASELLHGYFRVESISETVFTTMTGRKREGYTLFAQRAGHTGA